MSNILSQSQRIGQIVEISPSTGHVILEDKYGGHIQASFHVQDAFATIPSLGEYWMVMQNGRDWLLHKRLEDGSEHIAITELNPGDRRMDSPLATSHVLGEYVNISGSNNISIGSNTNVDINSPLININSDSFILNNSPILTLDTLPTPTISVTNSGTFIGTQPTLNLISGTYINISTINNTSNDSIDIQISAVPPQFPGETFKISGSTIGTENAFNLIPDTNPNGVPLMTFAGTDNTSSGQVDMTVTPRINVQVNGGPVGARRTINFKPGSNITISGTDSSANNRTEVTITASSSYNPLVFGNTFAGSVAVPASSQVSLISGPSVTWPSGHAYIFEYFCPSFVSGNITAGVSFDIYLNDGGSFNPVVLLERIVTDGSGQQHSIYGKTYVNVGSGTRTYSIWADNNSASVAVTIGNVTWGSALFTCSRAEISTTIPF